MLRGRFISFTIVLGIGFLLLVSLVISTFLSALNDWVIRQLPLSEAVLQFVNFGISFMVITLLFAVIYKVLPDAYIRWKDVWIGAGVTSLLFSIGKFLIGLYLGKAASHLRMARRARLSCCWCGFTTLPSFSCLARSSRRFMRGPLARESCQAAMLFL